MSLPDFLLTTRLLLDTEALAKGLPVASIFIIASGFGKFTVVIAIGKS